MVLFLVSRLRGTAPGPRWLLLDVNAAEEAEDADEDGPVEGAIGLDADAEGASGARAGLELIEGEPALAGGAGAGAGRDGFSKVSAELFAEPCACRSSGLPALPCTPPGGTGALRGFS